MKPTVKQITIYSNKVVLTITDNDSCLITGINSYRVAIENGGLHTLALYDLTAVKVVCVQCNPHFERWLVMEYANRKP